MKKHLIFLLFLFSFMGINAQDKMSAIDVHSHVVTDEYLKYLSDNDALMEDGYPLPSWDVDSHLAFMDSVGIDRSVLTLSSPQPWFGDLKKSRAVIRSVNEKMAETKRSCPGRFLWCAALPQPSVEASVEEVVFALDSLGADGGPSVQAVKMLLTVTTPDHLLFGTDYPFVPAPALQKVAAKVMKDISEDEELGKYSNVIFRNNALKLFKKN